MMDEEGIIQCQMISNIMMDLTDCKTTFNTGTKPIVFLSTPNKGMLEGSTLKEKRLA